MKNVSKGTIVRTVVLIFALINQTLVMFGKNPFPFSDEQIYTAASTVLTIAASLVAWWKNNSFTKEAIEADTILKDLKKKEC